MRFVDYWANFQPSLDKKSKQRMALIVPRFSSFKGFGIQGKWVTDWLTIRTRVEDFERYARSGAPEPEWWAL